MNKNEIIEDIEDYGKEDIQYIYDNLVDTNELKEHENIEIEITDDILQDLKKLIIEIVKVDDNFAKRVSEIIDNDNRSKPADPITAVTIITLASICALITIHANELRVQNPNANIIDCKDILRNLHLDKLYDKIDKFL